MDKEPDTLFTEPSLSAPKNSSPKTGKIKWY